MAETTVNTGVPATASSGNPIVGGLSRGLASPQLGALFALASALTLGVGLIMWSLRPDFVPVSEQGSQMDALQVIDVLKSSGVEYRLDSGTGLVLVPQDQLAQVRMTLSASGLSAGDSVGLELLHQEPSLGISHFTETARYQHGLETELSRTISSMRNIDTARVHLALPRQSVFVRDRVEASASVMVKAAVGRDVDEEQVSAIAGLVASSIPYLDNKQVTVVDQWGRLLSSGGEDSAGVSRKQFEYARRLETLYASRVESLLTPMLGMGRVRATVTAEVDFSTNEQTQELFDPDNAQLRSEQTERQVSDQTGAVGIPGALTNQPPGGGAIADADNPDGAEPAIVNESTTAIRNYELDKTITHSRQAPGSIRRLSAAVVIDDLISVDETGATVRAPVSEEAMAEYTALVREAIGFDEVRGDTVVVFNSSFQPPELIEPVEPMPIWEQAWVWNGVRQFMIGLAVLLIVLMIVRPAAKRLLPTVAVVPELSEDSMAALEAEKQKTASLEAPSVVYGDILNMARAMAAEDPKRVAIVVKDWVRES